MTEKALKFNNIRVTKKEFHKSNKPIDLMSVNIDQIVVSNKFNHNANDFKYFIGYQEGDIVKSLCIILPQMSGYIKCFEYEGQNISFLIKDDKVQEKYKQIWDVIKNKLKIKFHGLPVYYKKYLKTKVREYEGMPKENIHYTCIACITIDSVMKMDKKYFPQVCLGECKYKIKKIQMSRFINTELDLDSESNLESDSESDDEAIAKLKSDSDNDSDNYSE